MKDNRIISPPSIPARGSNHSQGLPFLSRRLARVPSQQEELKKVPKELQCNIFECESGAMEQFEDVSFVVDLLQRGDIWMPERAVRLLDQRPKLIPGDLRRRDIE